MNYASFAKSKRMTAYDFYDFDDSVIGFDEIGSELNASAHFFKFP